MLTAIVTYELVLLQFIEPQEEGDENAIKISCD